MKKNTVEVFLFFYHVEIASTSGRKQHGLVIERNLKDGDYRVQLDSCCSVGERLVVPGSMLKRYTREPQTKNEEQFKERLGGLAEHINKLEQDVRGLLGTTGTHATWHTDEEVARCEADEKLSGLVTDLTRRVEALEAQSDRQFLAAEVASMPPPEKGHKSRIDRLHALLGTIHYHCKQSVEFPAQIDMRGTLEEIAARTSEFRRWGNKMPDPTPREQPERTALKVGDWVETTGDLGSGDVFQITELIDTLNVRGRSLDGIRTYRWDIRHLRPCDPPSPEPAAPVKTYVSPEDILESVAKAIDRWRAEK